MKSISTDHVRLAFFDLDGTLVDGYEYIYQHLWDFFGVEKEQTREILRQYIRQEITYKDWVNNDVRLLQEAGATKQSILEAVSSLSKMTGALDVLEELKSRGFKIFVISGGIDLVVEAVFGDDADRLFDEVFINRYHFDQTGKLINATATQYDMEHKATCITEIAKKYGVNPEDCYFIGDNENDIDAALLAGTSIAFNSKSDALTQASTHIVASTDLRDILKYIDH